MKAHTMKKSLGLLTAVTLSFALVACGGESNTKETTAGGTAAEQTVKVNVGSSSKGAVTAIQIEVAQALGFFKEEGLDANVIYFKSGTESAGALVSGQIDFSVNAVDHAIKAREQNKTLKMIASFTDKPSNTLVVSSSLKDSVKSVKDLKGKKIGVTGVGSGTHILTTYVLQKNGMTAEDVQIVPIGSASNFIAAFKNNAIDAGMVFDPTSTQLTDMNFTFPLIDMSDDAGTKQVFTEGGYQFTGLLTTEDVINNKKDVAQRMVNAMIKSNQYIATHKAEEIVAKLPADVVGKDKDLYLKSFAHTQPAISKDGVVSKKAVENNLEALKAYDPKNEAVKTLDAASLYDMQFVENSKK